MGCKVRLLKPCEPRGTVKLEGVLWHAESLDRTTIPAGTLVIVRDLEGLTLIVEPTEKDLR